MEHLQNYYMSKKNNDRNILVSGGAGFVGSVLVPKLVKKGYRVRVFDTFWFWNSSEEFLHETGLKEYSNIELVKGDLRNLPDVRKAVQGIDTVIQLACISNDPSSKIDPEFTHSINYNGNINIIDAAKQVNVNRFIYASSSSVYGIKKEPRVTESMKLEPLTQYSELKVEIEHYLLNKLSNTFKGMILRPSTVCGYSPRQRLDVVVNILTNFAVNKGKIKVFGGSQLRPNIHIEDMTNLYVQLVEADIDTSNRKIYNAGWENLSVMEIAQQVKQVVGEVEIETVPTDDIRSYHISSDKITYELGFTPKKKVKDAVSELKQAFAKGMIKDPDGIKYYNVKLVKQLLGV